MLKSASKSNNEEDTSKNLLQMGRDKILCLDNKKVKKFTLSEEEVVEIRS